MSGRLRIALAGGNFGLRILLPALRLAGLEVTTFIGRDAAHAATAARAHAIPHAVTSIEALAGDVEAVALALPPEACAAAARAALARSLPVFAEKPLAASRGAAASLAAAAAGVATAVDFEFMELAPFRALARLAAEGTLGALRRVCITWHARSTALDAAAPAWKRDPSAGGGVLGLYGVHVLHALEALFGPIAALAAEVAPPPEPWAVLRWDFPGGGSGCARLDLAAAGPPFQRWEIAFEHGSALLENGRLGSLMGFELALAASTAPPVVDAEALASGPAPAIARLARRFAAAVQQAGRSAPDFAAAARTLGLVEAAREASASGRMVVLG